MKNQEVATAGINYCSWALSAKEGSRYEKPERVAAAREGQPTGKELLSFRKITANLLPPGRRKTKRSVG